MVKLAIHGGRPAVTIRSAEQWRRPVEEEKKLIHELLEKGEISGAGRGLPKNFEEEFKEYVGCEYCLTASHGSTALESAYYAVGVGPGDEVITPAAGYLGSYSGALHMGARPVFCEIDAKTLLMDPDDVEKRITNRTRAINPVHMCGNVCDMDALMDVGRRYGVAIVEDAAHAAGSEWGDKKIGNVGDIACFSLQGVNPSGKPVAGGEGGIVCTSNREFYERQLIYCHLHRTGVTDELTNPEYRRLDSEVLGLKYRAHPIALAIAKVSLSSLAYRTEKGIGNRNKIFDALREMPGLEPVQSYKKAKWAGLYGGWQIIYNPEELDGLPVQKFVEAIKAEGLAIRGHGWASGHPGEHLRSIFTRAFDLWGHDRGPLGGKFMSLPPFKVYKRGDFPVTESLADRVLKLPAYIEPKEGFIDQCIEAFGKVTSNYKSLL